MKIRLLFLLFALSAALITACARTTSEMPAVVEVVKEQVVQGENASKAQPDNPASPGENPAPDADLALLGYNPASQMVIKNGMMEILVDDTDQVLGQVTRLTSEYGGYILSSETWYQDTFKHGRLTLRIPSTSFENALNSLRTIGIRVIQETASGQDVSAEYTDLKSKLTNLEATAERVRGFLADAASVEESLNINETLSELEEQIETVKGWMNYYEGLAAYSTITVEITPQIPTPEPSPTPTPTPTPTPIPGWNPGETLGSASGVLVDITQRIIDMLIWLIVVLGPFLLILGLMFWIGRKIGKRYWHPTTD